jgi:HNH endonuclease
MHHSWKGGITYQRGRRVILTEDGRRFEHRIVAERALGHALPRGAVIHHIDENPLNNANNNLVICEGRAYHALIHVRARVLHAGGNPDLEKFCTRCKALLFVSQFSKDSNRGGKTSATCKECHSRYHAEYYKKKKAASA